MYGKRDHYFVNSSVSQNFTGFEAFQEEIQFGGLTLHSLKINHLAEQLVLGIGALNFQLGAETAAG